MLTRPKTLYLYIYIPVLYEVFEKISTTFKHYCTLARYGFLDPLKSAEGGQLQQNFGLWKVKM